MKTKIITSQSDFDKIKEVKPDEEVIFKSSKIKINCILDVYGILRLEGEIDSSWNGRYIRAWECSQVHNEARESSQVHNEARASSQVHNVAWASSQVKNVAWESSQVHNEAWESSQVHNEASNHSVITNIGFCASMVLRGFAVAMLPFDLKIKIKKEKTCHVQRFKPQDKYLERESVDVKNKSVILYKRTSSDFKTQENTPNETLWLVGSTITHPHWEPKLNECGAGKFHACSRPYFCDEFRNEKKDDKYIAVQIQITDLYEWPQAQYPHKIAFREGKVLREVDKFGKEIV